MSGARSYIVLYADPLPGGKGQLRQDVIMDGKLVTELCTKVGSPAPIETVRRHEGIYALGQKQKTMSQRMD